MYKKSAPKKIFRKPLNSILILGSVDTAINCVWVEKCKNSFKINYAISKLKLYLDLETTFA